MARISLSGFKDPVRRPRFIIWTGVIVLVLAAVVVLALGITSSRWFCAEGCHKVQDDTIISYSHSSHAAISCMACHMPVGADPVTFMLHKAEALGELYMTIANKYELPLNAEDELALDKAKMGTVQCTQCHNLATRKITTSPGIIINHDVHIKKGYTCTYCHNRVAHNEDFTLTLAGNRKHQDFMKMDACFRCHGLQTDAKAPGQCTTCHPKDFNLKPAFHLQAGFYPSGHAEMAKADFEKVTEAQAEAKKAGAADPALPSVNAVSNCGTCHVKSEFCDKCHGMSMPHSEAFKNPTDVKDPNGHPMVSQAKATAAKCEFCHHQSKTWFCDNCHHGNNAGAKTGTKGNIAGWTFDYKTPWQQQHAQAVDKNGVEGCLGKCHQASFCKDCHTRLKPVPTSHKSATWLHGAKLIVSDSGNEGTAKPSAGHVAAFQQAGGTSACAVCHGDGGTKAAFCAGCHKMTMPHDKTFKDTHFNTGKKNPAVCQNCHQFQQICSNCHHKGASDAKPWLGQHGASVTAAGNADSCFAKCHKKDFCVACHTRGKVVPASHKAANWLHRLTSSGSAQHTVDFDKTQGVTCTYCHGDGGTKAAFCMGCHKLPMPHPDGFGPAKGVAPTKDNGGDHAAGFRANPPKWPVPGGNPFSIGPPCNNCHDLYFCDSCHHKTGFNGTVWLQRHPAVVKSNGAAGCLAPDGCHEEQYCSHCHVNGGHL